MISIGTPNSSTCTKILLLGAGELGKEFALEAQRLGIHVVAVDRYANAPAMQVAHDHYVISMLDGTALRRVVEKEKPDFIVPEIEAIATDTLVELEAEGWQVVPTARATRLTMNREGIRRLAAEELALQTSPYRFARALTELRQAVEELGTPCVVKPLMSSSGKGQSVVRHPDEVADAWFAAQGGARGASQAVIVEGFVEFDYEITLLTVRHAHGTSFCEPIGHRQVGGDYHESWQPQPMSEQARQRAEAMARAVTDALGGRGLFGVEFFCRGDEVWFSEVSPRPHDTGMVTMITQDLSEFALHLRAILGLPIPKLRFHGAGASHVILGADIVGAPRYEIDADALAAEDTSLRLFAKPEASAPRRLGVALARGASVAVARERAAHVAQAVRARSAK